MKRVMQRLRNVVVVCAVAGICVCDAQAEDIPTMFGKVHSLVEQKNYAGALNELGWVQQEIEKLHQQRLIELIPADVEGFKGEEPQVKSAMGFTSLERNYVKGAQQISLSLMGGSGSDSAGLGGLAGLAKMGAMMGSAQRGIERVRVEGLTATLNTMDTPELIVFLDSGSMVQVRAESGVDAATIKKFAEGLKLSELDTYLRGTKS